MREQPVRELMTTDVLVLDPQMTYKAVVRALVERGVDAAPVVHRGQLLGVVSMSDLTAHEEEPASFARRIVGGRHEREHARKCKGRTARELMTAPAKCVSPDVSVTQALHEMNRAGVGRLVVVEPGTERLCGILTRSDVLRVYLREDDLLRRDAEQVLERTVRCEYDVDVAVHDGVVRLLGWVERASCGWAAVAAISRLPGVVDVQDEMTYRVDDALTEELALRGPFV